MMDREDLAALFARATRRLIDAERRLLEGHDLAMWDYIVLSHLAREPAGTQLVLAQAIGYDKTRLVRLLDQLEEEGFVVRERDPADRRARIVHLTNKGRKVHAAAQADIRTMEDQLLAGLSSAARRQLLAALTKLASDAGGEPSA